MLELSLFGIPIYIGWFFWISCILMGGGLDAQSSDAWMRVVMWTWVVLISITVHEVGHALAGRRFGADSIIKLHGFGGVTIFDRPHFTRFQSIFVSAAGPISGFCLAGLVFISALFLHPKIDSWEGDLLGKAWYVNFFWTIINLLPIQPLDGGQIFRELMGPERVQITNNVGIICAVGAAIWAFRHYQPYLGVMMLFLAWRNFTSEYGEGGVMSR